MIRGLVMLVAASACAPTALAPSIVRTDPLDPTIGENMLGVRTGPRLVQDLATLRRGGLDADVGTPLPPELGVAIELQRTQPIGSLGFAAHLGAQAEVVYALPAPALGLMAGISYLKKVGPLTIAPAIAARGSTDFGSATLTPSGSLLSADATVAFSLHEGDSAVLGLAPFFSIAESLTRDDQVTVFMPGVMLFARLKMIEVVIGVTRVFAPGGTWNVPLIGVRTVGQ